MGFTRRVAGAALSPLCPRLRRKLWAATRRQTASLMRIHSVAPTRIDLAGGTLDIWPLYLLHPGAFTINLAITRFAHCVLESRRDSRLFLVSRDAGQREEFSSLGPLFRARRFRLPLLAHLVSPFKPRRGL